MAVVTRPLHALEASGSVGGTVAYSARRGQQIATPTAALQRPKPKHLQFHTDLFTLAGRFATDLRNKGLIFNISEMYSYDNIVLGWVQNYSTYALRPRISGGLRPTIGTYEDYDRTRRIYRRVFTDYYTRSPTTFHTFIIRILIGTRLLSYKIARGRWRGMNNRERRRYNNLASPLEFNHLLPDLKKLEPTFTRGFLLAWIYWTYRRSALWRGVFNPYPAGSQPQRDPQGRLEFTPIGQRVEEIKWRRRYVDTFFFQRV